MEEGTEEEQELKEDNEEERELGEVTGSNDVCGPCKLI